MDNYEKASPEPSAPGMYGMGPGTAPPPPNPGNAMYYPSANPPHPGNYPQYNVGYAQGQNMVVTSQPTIIMAPAHVYEKDYLIYSIFNMICCCICLGGAALIFSVKTRDANHRGDINEARAHSKTAQTLNHVALGIGLAIFIAWVAYVIYINLAVQNYINNAYNSNDLYDP